FHHMNRIPINLIQEIRYLFPNEWANINNLREFKTNLIHELIDEGIKENYIKQDVSTDIILLILSNTLPAIFDYDFLSNNKFNINQSIDEIIKIIFYGIVS
ncbi:MAG: hypothetical protein Q8942_19635, partial [Bacillota bacterium]|nr:hypothetical protein [Bacillota bacterium]